MDGPALIPLPASRVLADSVAAHLAGDAPRGPLDLGDTEVWVPTAGAGRRIRRALAGLAAEAGTGVLSPRFVQPMAAILPENPARPIASRAEREAVWAAVLAECPREEVEHVFPDPRLLDGDRALLASGGVLCGLCDLLAEGGLAPSDSRIVQVCDDDPRWERIAALYVAYLARIDAVGLLDPNASRIAQIRSPRPAPGLRRVVIACVPDLPRAAERYALGLAAKGVAIEVLVAPVGRGAARIDPWGRPDPDAWAHVPIDVDPAQIRRAKDPGEEAANACDFVTAATTPGDYAIVLADPTLAVAAGSEILRRGGEPFSPEGRRLAASEAAAVALGWIAWRREPGLRAIRPLLEGPHFNRWLGREAGLAPSQVLAAADYLIGDLLCESPEQARAALAGNPRRQNESLRAAAGSLLDALDAKRPLGAHDVLAQIWSPGNDGADEAARVIEIWRNLESSPVFRGRDAFRECAFAREVAGAATFSAASDGAVELSGWLEAPWSEAGRIAVLGCVEGRLPASVTEHAFLPDSRRAALGLADNASRRARDAFVLSGILSRQASDEAVFSFSKSGADGSPQLPSSLLLRCPDDQLPARVRALFGDGEVAAAQSPSIGVKAWRWTLPDAWRKPPPDRISPTDFRQYLACPTRFYLARVARLESPDPRRREMSATDFGSLVHDALEAFGREIPDEPDARKIRAFVSEKMRAAAAALFGPDPAPAVRVQIEAADALLGAFAFAQARAREAGWKILAAERKLEADGPDPLRIGPLPVSGKIDRIDEHPEHGLRVIDYKTFRKKKDPAKAHLATFKESPFLPEAVTESCGKPRRWVDLQLPVYRRMAERWFPGRPVQLAYFLVMSDPAETSVLTFDLDDSLAASADACAEAVAERVARGNFWPPQTIPPNWDDAFAPIFAAGPPDECIHPETAEFLKGGR